MSSSNLPKRYEGSAVSDALQDSEVIELAKEKQEFVTWLQSHVHTRPMRALAIEAAAYHFANQHLQKKIEEFHAKAEEMYRRRINLSEMFGKHRMRLAADWKQLEVTIAQADFRKAKFIRETNQLLQPSGQEEMERAFTAEKVSLIKTRLEQRRQRYSLRAATADAAERARLRAEFVSQLRTEYDDPSVVEEATDEYDRTILRLSEEEDNL